jgi:hypothetical protein
MTDARRTGGGEKKLFLFSSIKCAALNAIFFPRLGVTTFVSKLNAVATCWRMRAVPAPLFSPTMLGNGQRIP